MRQVNERYQAEALVHQHLPITGLLGIVCYTQSVKDSLDTHIQREGLKLDVRVMPQWYF
jgi:hypothetical protein